MATLMSAVVSLPWSQQPFPQSMVKELLSLYEFPQTQVGQERLPYNFSLGTGSPLPLEAEVPRSCTLHITLLHKQLTGLQPVQGHPSPV